MHLPSVADVSHPLLHKQKSCPIFFKKRAIVSQLAVIRRAPNSDPAVSGNFSRRPHGEHSHRGLGSIGTLGCLSCQGPSKILPFYTQKTGVKVCAPGLEVGRHASLVKRSAKRPIQRTLMPKIEPRLPWLVI